MLKVAASNLIDEIAAAEDAARDKLKYLRQMRAGYASPDFANTAEADYENVAFSMVSLLQPMTAFGYPVHDLTSTRGPDLWGYVEGFRIGLDRVCRDIEIPDIYEAVGLDAMFGWGVAMVSREPLPGDWEPGTDGRIPHRPAVYRIAPERFVLDHKSLTMRESRYMGHKWGIDKDDLLDLAETEDGWNYETIKALVDACDKPRQYSVDDTADYGPDRETVYLYDVWVPETGELYTIPAPESLGSETDVIGGGAALKHATKGYVRDPREYYGPRSGPYVVFGQYMVPSSPWPLASLVANMEQARALNERVRKQVTLARTRRRFTVIKGDPDFAAEIENAPDRTVFTRSAYDNTQLSEVQVGGVDPGEMEAIIFERDLLYRNLGLTEEMRGLNSSDTATSSAYANNAAASRLQGIQAKMKRGYGSISRKMLEFMIQDDEMAIPLGDAGIDAFGMPNMWIVGDEENDLRIEDFELSINVGSSQRQNEAVMLQRFVELVALQGNISQLSKTSPEWDYITLWQMACRKYEMREMEGLLDPDKLEAVQAIALAGQMAPSGSQGKPSEPQRLAGDQPKGRVIGPPAASGGRAGGKGGVKGVSPSGGSRPTMQPASSPLELD